MFIVSFPCVILCKILATFNIQVNSKSSTLNVEYSALPNEVRCIDLQENKMSAFGVDTKRAPRVHAFFHKHHRYKHRQPESLTKNKHQPNTSPSLTSISTYNFSKQCQVTCSIAGNK